MVNKILIYLFSMMCLASVALASFVGPSTVIQGSWGQGSTDFGFESSDPMDSFPGLVVVDEAGNILIGDGVNNRIKLYDSAGNWKNNITFKGINPGASGWPANLHAKANVGIFSIYEKLQKYDYSGNLVWAVALNGFEDFWIADDGGVWVQEYGKNIYDLYSSTGQLSRTSTTRPLELGTATVDAIGGGKYRHTIQYPDATYALISDKEYDGYSRDENKYLYLYLPGLVDKFNACGKLLGRLLLPANVEFKGDVQPDGEQYVMTHDEYGGPVLDIHGNVYTWKKSPSKYSILKWTWVNDPSDPPSGPDAPTGLTVTPSTSGLYLTWTASPQDPGCVTGYEVSRATTAGGTYSVLTTVATGITKYNDTTATAGTTYYYKVRAVSGSDYSPYTTEISGKR